MMEAYSVAAQHVVASATSEARELEHSRVGTEHLLLALLSEEAGDTADVLRAAGASLSAARHMVAELLKAEVGSPPGEELPLTPRAQRALDRAGRFSRQERAAEVTAGHVLLGVLDVEGLACQVLRGLDVDVAHLRDAAATSEAAVAPARGDPPSTVEPVRPRCPRCRARLDDTLVETHVAARGESGSATDVTVVHCGACGAALGVLRPEPGPS